MRRFDLVSLKKKYIRKKLSVYEIVTDNINFDIMIWLGFENVKIEKLGLLLIF